MSFSDGSNINSLKIARQVGRVSGELSTTFERLSSGLRINRASDDPAGLAVANDLSFRSRAARQGIRNANDAVSLFVTADAALEVLSAIVSRQQELALQAANSLYTSSQRTSLDTEAAALTEEYNRIVQSTEFNRLNVLDGTSSTLTIQAGSSALSIQGVNLNSAVSTFIGNGTFQAALTYSTGTDPLIVTSADLNGDGKVDLVSVDQGSNRFSILLGNGNGTFQAATSLATGSLPYWVTSADVDGDGKVDLISADYVGNRVSVFLGNGNGTFQAVRTLSVGGNPVSVTAADVNGDGKVDLVSADTNANRLSILLSNGNGTFQAAITASTGIGPYAVTSADFNGDGKLDLMSADSSGNRLSVFLGNGNGTFQTAISVATGSGPYAATVGDINGDGKIDLISADSASNRLSVFLGNGNGTFQAALTLTTGTLPSGVSAADLNGDGKLDLMSADYNSNRISYFLGNGNGTFQAVRTLTTGTNPNSVTPVDVNGDGVLDLVSADVNSDRLSIFIQNGTTTSISSLLQSAISLTSIPGATQAQTYLSAFATKIESARGTVGASLSRLEIAISNLVSTADNLEQAQSRILDIDIAEEVAKMVRLQIVQQTATALLAQANQQGFLVTRLLEDL